MPNKTDRPGKILSAFRKVDSESSSLIGGVLGDLMGSEDIPVLRNIPTGHRAFVFDPRLLDKRFNKGFIAGVQFERLRSRVDVVDTHHDDTLSARIGEVVLLPDKRRTLLLELIAPELTEERRAFYASLAHIGISGFTVDGHISGRRNVGNPTISIGTFAQPVSKANEGDILDAVATSIEVSFASYGGDVELGPLEVRTFSPGR